MLICVDGQLLVSDIRDAINQNETDIGSLNDLLGGYSLVGLTSTINELNILTGALLDVNELNILNGLLASTAELNILNGATLDTNELNLLNGVTATTAQLNYLNTATSDIQSQLDAKVDDTVTDDVDFNGYKMYNTSVRGITDAAPLTGTTHTFNYANGDMQQITCPAAGTLTLAIDGFPPNGVSGFIVDIINGGNCTITYPIGMLFALGLAPLFTVSGTDRCLITSDKDGILTLTVIGYDIKAI